MIGLDATHLGEPIYRRSGFDVVGDTVRWEGVAANAAYAPMGIVLREGFHHGILELDRRCAGIDRSALLRDLGQTARMISLEAKGATTAYAVVRPGRSADHVGPVVATDPENFARIFGQAVGMCAGGMVMCDVLNEKAGDVLLSHGLKPVRHLKRMTSPLKDGCLCGDGIWCGAGFELG